MHEVIKTTKYDARVLVFEPGEKVISSLAKYCEENRIRAGWIDFIGACQEVDLFYYDLDQQKYLSRDFGGNLEVLPCSGDISIFNHKTIVHVHGSFSNREYGVVGGHVNEMTISGTLEVRLQVFQGQILRKLDRSTGLNTMCPAI